MISYTSSLTNANIINEKYYTNTWTCLHNDYPGYFQLKARYIIYCCNSSAAIENSSDISSYSVYECSVCGEQKIVWNN